MTFQFSGTALDVQVAMGPRGGLLSITVDGSTKTVSLYRAPSDPAHPDTSGP